MFVCHAAGFLTIRDCFRLGPGAWAFVTDPHLGTAMDWIGQKGHSMLSTEQGTMTGKGQQVRQP